MKHAALFLFFFLFFINNWAVAQVVFPVKKGDKWGLIDEKGETFLSATYDAIGKIDEFGFAIIQIKDKVGLMNQRGEVVFNPQFQDIKIINSELFGVKQADNWTIINKEQKIILKQKYNKIELLENGAFLLFYWENKCGLATREGKLITSAQYDAILPSPVGTFYIKKNEKYGIMNLDGEEILSPKFDKIKYDIQNFIFVQNENLWGIFDAQINEILPLEWQDWVSFSGSIIRLRKKENAVLFDLNTRQFITNKKYDNYIPYSDDKIVVRQGKKVGLINLEGRELLTCRYSEIQPFTNELYRVKNEDFWGLVQDSDSLVLPTKYDFIAPLSGSVGMVKSGQTFGIVNIQGQIVIPFEFSKINIEESQAKAYQGVALTVYNFDDDGNLQNEYNYKKVGSIKVGRTMRRRTPTQMTQDFQIGKFEWYHDAMQDLWGLRNIETGKDQIPPSYDRIRIERDLGFTIVGKKASGRFEIDRTEFRFDYVYGIVNNERGLPVTEMNMWDIRLTDFKDKNLPTARVIFTDGRHGLMAKNGKMLQKDLLFIGEFEDGLVNFSPKGTLSVTLSKNDANLGLLGNYLSAMLSPNYMASVTNYDEKLRTEGTLIGKDCLWGFMDSLGQTVIQPQFSFARQFKNEVAIVKVENNWGLIDKTGKSVLECVYNDVQYLENSESQMIQVLVRKERIGLIDCTGKVIVPAIYTNLGEVQEGRIAIESDGKWGFCDLNGNEIIACQYEKVQDFSEGLAAFRKDRKWGFIDLYGNMVIKNEYRNAGNFKENLAPVSLRYDYQYIDKSGKIVIETLFDEAYDFENGVARVKHEKEWALIDWNGNFICQSSKYLKIEPFDENGLAIVQMDGNHRYFTIINKKGEKITNKKYNKIEPFTNGFAAVRTDKGYGFINRSGEAVVDFDFTNVEPFSENIAAVQVDGKWGYIDTLGSFILAPKYSKVLPFQDDFGVVYDSYNSSGLVDASGNFTILPEVNRILAFSQGKGLVRNQNYQYSFITENNKLAKGFFEEALPYKNGVAIIKNQGLWGLLTQQGVEIVPPKYDEIEPFKNGYAQIKIKAFKGITDLQGKVIVEPNYEYITYWGNGIFRVENGDKLGYFNVNGDWIWAME
jgi:hypothetical protein